MIRLGRNVLSSVPGTQKAREAVLDTQIPQTAEIDRKTATVTVAWDGDPEFESCTEGVAHARNADKSVLFIDGTYYCCDTAVRFTSQRPDGPWQVATEVPAVVQDLPPDCPVYNVKYVYIYESMPEAVFVGYTPGYYNCYVYSGCVPGRSRRQIHDAGHRAHGHVHGRNHGRDPRAALGSREPRTPTSSRRASS